jgi:arginine decarboxylase
MVPGQVITREIIDFMCKLDVKEIHGYEASKGLKLLKLEQFGEFPLSRTSLSKT